MVQLLHFPIKKGNMMTTGLDILHKAWAAHWQEEVDKAKENHMRDLGQYGVYCLECSYSIFYFVSRGSTMNSSTYQCARCNHRQQVIY